MSTIALIIMLAVALFIYWRILENDLQERRDYITAMYAAVEDPPRPEPDWRIQQTATGFALQLAVRDEDIGSGIVFGWEWATVSEYPTQEDAEIALAARGSGET